MFRKKEPEPTCDCGKFKVWGVTTHGTSKTTGLPTERVYGPYYDKHAALDFKLYWEDRFAGVAIVDFRYINERVADLGEV